MPEIGGLHGDDPTIISSYTIHSRHADLVPFLERAWRLVRIYDAARHRADGLEIRWAVSHGRHQALAEAADGRSTAVEIRPGETYWVRMFGIPVEPVRTDDPELLTLLLSDRKADR